MSVYLGSLFLTLPGIVKAIIGKLMVIAILLQGAFWGSDIFEYRLERYKRQKKEEQDAADLTTFTALGFIVRLVIWSKESSSLIPPKRSSSAKKTAAPTPRRRKTNKRPIKNEPVAGENLGDRNLPSFLQLTILSPAEPFFAK